jgi:N-acetylneuraminic acid mutarotase
MPANEIKPQQGAPMNSAARIAKILPTALSLFALCSVPAAAQGTWSTKAAMPTARADTNAVVLDNQLYVIGGTQGAEPFAANERYDPATDRWRTLAPMPRGIHHQALAVANGKIYAFGGFTAPAHGGPIDVGLEYDPKADSWRTLPKLSSPRGSPSGVGLNGRIHVIGGRGADAVTLPIHEVFDPATNQWSTAAPLPKGRDHAGLVAAGGKIHAIGGRLAGPDTNQNFHDVYDPATNTWTAAAPLPTPRSSSGLTEYRGTILVLGGENEIMAPDPRGAHRENEAYDLKTAQWVKLAPLTGGRHAMGAWEHRQRRLFRRRRHHARAPCSRK